jgi:hypothetical protein
VLTGCAATFVKVQGAAWAPAAAKTRVAAIAQRLVAFKTASLFSGNEYF